LDEDLLSRIEDAGLNASAPPQQRWLDGWLVRTSPGKAKRARCINAVALGRLPVDTKLGLSATVFAEAQLPMVVRITRFTQPAGLDAQLAERGFTTLDDTRVMVCTPLPNAEPEPPPPGTHWARLDAQDYAEAVGALRGSPPVQRQAHAERLRLSPVRYEGHVLRDAEARVLACGQFAREAELVGLYDVFTREDQRGRGLARLVCQRLLALASAQGARVGYLQVEASNHPARRIYQRLGFADAYAYHYRLAPGAQV
jgi:GNAT superfamily N-acetyltransferase